MTVRGALSYLYTACARVSVLCVCVCVCVCVCLASRRIGRRRTLATTALRRCSDRAQVARVTFAALHS